MDGFNVALSMLIILFMESIHLLQRHRQMRSFPSAKPWYIRWAVYYMLVMGILFFGKLGEQTFIYFQF